VRLALASMLCCLALRLDEDRPDRGGPHGVRKNYRPRTIDIKFRARYYLKVLIFEFINGINLGRFHAAF
jgi:hypothetical protein